MSNPFVNRIVGYTTKRASELTANPANWRKHPEKQRRAVQASLRELGWIGAVVENVRTGFLVDGHERVWQALAKDEEVPVLQVDLSEAEERLALATFDPITYMAETDSEILDALLREVNTGEEALQELLAGLAEENGLYQDSKKDVDAEPQIDRAEALCAEWGTQLGQLWQLGEHSLIVGDCTDADVVARVMGGEKADMVFTDPPYGVDYDGGLNEKKRTKLEGDKTGDLYLPALKSLKSICTDGAPMYVWFAASVGKPVYDAVEAIGYKVRAMIVWNKLDAHYGNFMAQYMQKHEPCLYIVNGNASWAGPTNEVTVWDIKQPNVNEHHPTQKPVELAVRAIRNHAADIVADWFGGSGTTIIACEQLGRKCRAVEISAGYVAVALQRWADATGKTPVLVE